MNCLISYSSIGRENYNRHLMHLLDSAENKLEPTGYMIYSPDHHLEVYNGIKINKPPVDCPDHKKIPYGFKPFMFLEAFKKGFEYVIWCDSTVMVHAKTKAFEHAKKHKVGAWHNLGHDLDNYVNDTAIKGMGMELNNTPQIMACVIVFHVSGMDILQRWWQAREYFKEDETNHTEFVAHRHDQAILSWILYEEGIPLIPYGTLCYPPYQCDFDIEFVNRER